MLKRNLFAIAIITLGLGITNAFGQAADWEIKPAVKNSNPAIKKNNSVKSHTATVNNNENRAQSNKQNKLGSPEIQSLSECQQQIDWIKTPRNTASGQATGKRQHLPVKNKNLGDTGTHEVGHKQRKKRN
ncbi:MAG TPA: hypothetical protein PKY82_35815 [Pyrinomonadaceae bacterium]|nr:hypothetical protein [Pyrinomonadaceae bacterium]